MNNEMKWIKHDGVKCPVPAECMVFTEWDGQNGIERSDKPSRAGQEVWNHGNRDYFHITAFALASDQPPQLDGPRTVGASYITRDGRILVSFGPVRSGSEFHKFSDGHSRDNFGAWTTGHVNPEDLIARYYPPAQTITPAATVASEPPNPSANEQDARKAWEQKHRDKCARNIVTGKPTSATPAPETEAQRVARALGTVAGDRSQGGHLVGVRMGLIDMGGER